MSGATTSTIDGDVVTVERLVNAPADRIFALLADPSKHSEFDGSDSVRASRADNPQRLSLGARFGMSMHKGFPYRVTNEVVEFEEGRRIAWRNVGRSVWRYELEHVAGVTLVRETFDATHARGRRLLRLTGVHEKNCKAMESTLERIAWLTEGRQSQQPEGRIEWTGPEG